MTERECGCPSWVVMCAHWNGSTMWLYDMGAWCSAHKVEPWKGDTEAFHVHLGKTVLDCGSQKTHVVCLVGADPGSSEWASLDAARTEFWRREPVLLEQAHD